jgi:hypothetical protein
MGSQEYAQRPENTTARWQTSRNTPNLLPDKSLLHSRPFAVPKVQPSLEDPEQAEGLRSQGASLLKANIAPGSDPNYLPPWVARAQAMNAEKLATDEHQEELADSEAVMQRSMGAASPEDPDGVQHFMKPCFGVGLTKIQPRLEYPDQVEIFRSKGASLLKANIPPQRDPNYVPPWVARAQAMNAEKLSADDEHQEALVDTEATVQRSMGATPPEDPDHRVSRSGAGASQGQMDLEGQLGASKGRGSPLPDEVRRFMEPRFGVDFGGVRVHTGGDAVQMNRSVGAKAFAHGSDIYYGAGNGPGNDELTAHELTHTIQQAGVSQQKNKSVNRKINDVERSSIPAKSIAQTIVPFNRSGLNRQTIDSEAEKEESLQAKTLPPAPITAINRVIQPALESEDEQEIQAKSLPDQASAFSTQSSSIDGKIIQAKSLTVSSATPQVQRGVLDRIGSGIRNAASGVADTVGGGLDAIRQRLLQPVAGLASRMPGYPLLTLILGRDPVTGAAVERNATNLVQGILSFVPGGAQMFQNLQESRALENAFNWLGEQVTRLNLTWDAIRGLFQRAWDSLSAGDLLDPSGAFERIRSIFVEPIQRIRNFASAAGQKVLEFIFEGAIRLAGGSADIVMGVIRRAGGVFTNIIRDPIAFVGNLVRAIRGGFEQFAGNILTHLRSGLMGWLFGALAGSGLQMPQTFDLRGIVSIVLQVIGATYQRLRGMLARRIGEQRVARLEQAFSFLQTLATEGLAGAWQQIMEFAGNLQEMVIGGIREWVMNSIVGAAVSRLVSMFNPAGAVIQAAMAIYNTVMFFVERAQQIAALANSVFESIGNIASGNIGGAIAYVEQAMARTLPVIISFMARLLGLGNVSGQIRNIIGRVQGAVERAIERLVGWITTRARGLLGRRNGTGMAASEQTQNPQNEQRIGAGLRAIDQKEQQYLQEGKISRQNAERVASEVKRENSVFESIAVVDGVSRWNYDYIARTIKTGEEKKNEEMQPSTEMESVEIVFNIRTRRFNPVPFRGQLRQQEDGIRAMKMNAWMANRNQFLETREDTGSGRSEDSGGDQRAFREIIRSRIIERRVAQGMSVSNAEVHADNWLSQRAALHGPDQIAGGGRTAGDIGRATTDDFSQFKERTGLIGMGDARINSSIGSQWRTRVGQIDQEVNKEKYTAEMKGRFNMNVVLVAREI